MMQLDPDPDCKRCDAPMSQHAIDFMVVDQLSLLDAEEGEFDVVTHGYYCPRSLRMHP